MNWLDNTKTTLNFEDVKAFYLASVMDSVKDSEQAGTSEGLRGNEAVVSESLDGGEVGETEIVSTEGVAEVSKGLGGANAVVNECLGSAEGVAMDNESSSDSSFVSECPSWMLEDLEGPWDDDIFVGRPSEHGRSLLKMVKKLLRNEKKKRRASNTQNAHGAEVGCSRDDEGWFSQPEDEDDLHSLSGSDNAATEDQAFNESMDISDVELSVGMKFPTRIKFREVLRDWTVRRGWDLKFLKNEKSKITATCRNGCEWRIHASSVMNTTTFQIKSLKGNHTCAHKTENKQAHYKYLGERIHNFVRDNPSEGLNSLKNKIRREIQVDVSLQKVYRAKKYALQLLKGEITQQYARLYDYCATICKHNPGSSLVVKVDRGLNPHVLQRMYFCLKGLRDGFLDGCRPLIGLDGCFLKGMYKGQLLSAIGRDGNDNIFPIAMAYVEIEKYDSWDWFLNLLFKDIGSHDERDWAFLSDRQKGLIEAVARHAPQAEHRFCLRHMYNNFKAKFKGQELKGLFWKAASTYNLNEHLKTMKEIERIYPKVGEEHTAFKWLSEIPSHQWARCLFPIRTKSDVVVNNISESFNHWILEARELPIIDMFEWLRRKFMIRIQTKREGIEKYEGNVCPNVLKKIEKQRHESRHCFPNWAGDDKFEVEHFMKNHIVSLNDKHCTCGIFQLVGYPCCHAIACINYHRMNVEDYVHNWFKKDVYLRVYSHMVHPIPGMHDYEDSKMGTVDPPHIKLRAGRPKKVRRRDANDVRDASVVSRKDLTHTCAICLQQGHNKRSCTNTPHPKSKYKQSTLAQDDESVPVAQVHDEGVQSVVDETGLINNSEIHIKATRKQKNPISLSSKRKQPSTSSSGFKRHYCSLGKKAISSQLRSISNSYKPETTKSASIVSSIVSKQPLSTGHNV